MESSLIRGDRGGVILVYRRYRYQRNKSHVDRTYWRCWRPECRVTLKTALCQAREATPNGPQVIAFTEHDHAPEDEMIDGSIFREQVMQAARDDPAESARVLYDREAGEQVEVPTLRQLRSSVNRARASVMPAIPQTVQEIVIEGPWAVTSRDKRFYLDKNEQWGVLVFATNSSLRALAASETMYVDGTFKTAPAPFRQLVTIHGKVHGAVVPLAFSLLQTKEQQAYRQMIQSVRNQIQALGLVWEPLTVISDFELSLIGAIQAELPGANVRGCFFHFTQSLLRKVTDLGLRAAYNNELPVKRLIRRYAAVAHLPLQVMRNSIENLRHRKHELFAAHPALEEFHDYFDRNYFGQGAFPPAMWNVHGRNMDTRTNNYAEAWNSAWNKRLRSRPSLWRLILQLKKQEIRTRRDIRQLGRGEILTVRRRKWRNLETRIQRLRAELANGGRNVNAFWKAVAYTFANII